MQSKPSIEGDTGVETKQPQVERLAHRADYQILLEQARRMWEVHQHDLQSGGYRPPKGR